MKIQSIAKLVSIGILSIGLGVTSQTENANAKNSTIRVAPIVYLSKDTKGLYFDDYTCKDYEQRFLVTNKEVKKLKLKKSYKQGKYYVGYFKNEITTYKIHEAKVKTIVKNGKKKKVLIDIVNGKVVDK